MAVSDTELENALRSMARIIERYGDVYWPIFERLEAELTARRTRAARLAAYRQSRESGPALKALPRPYGAARHNPFVQINHRGGGV